MILRLLSILIACALATPAVAKDRRPNVIVILADDLGVADLSAYGYRSAVPTPNIDKLAARGVRFTRGYATAAVCSPSRAALLSGRYQQRHGFEFLIPEAHNKGGDAPGLAPEQRLLPEALKKAGYRTAAIGKWHLGDTPDRLPTARGFDRFFGFLPGEIAYADAKTPGLVSQPVPYVGGRSFSRRLPYLEVGRWRAGSPAKETVKNEDRYLTQELTREAVDFIRSSRGKPYFLYLAHLAPHSPFQAPQAYVDRFAHEKDPTKRVYAALIASLDDAVGELMAAVEASGEADNTIVVFSADNGAATYLGVSNCADIAGGKLSHYEGGVRVPYLVSWPRRWPKGQVDGRNVSLLDVYPTVLAAAGLKPDGPLDGHDLTPFMAADARDRTVHETLFWRTGHEFAALSGDWKMISNTRAGAFPWLFDLRRDPTETVNLMFAERDRVKDLKARYDAWAKQLRPPAWPTKETLQVMHCGRISHNDQ